MFSSVTKPQYKLPVQNPTSLTSYILVKTNSYVYVEGRVSCLVKGQSCSNGQEILSIGDSLPVGQFQTANWDHCSGRVDVGFAVEMYKMNSDSKCRYTFKWYIANKDERNTNTTGSCGQRPAPLMVALFWLESEQQEGCFLHQELLWPTAWEKLWWPPTVFNPPSLTVLSHSFKGHCIPGCTQRARPKAWNSFHAVTLFRGACGYIITTRWPHMVVFVTCGYIITTRWPHMVEPSNQNNEDHSISFLTSWLCSNIPSYWFSHVCLYMK